MAGVSRLQYTSDIRLIRVMCSGRVDPEFILRSFANGVDGVFIGGCRLNECNYITHGNYHALNMVLLYKRIMERLGLNPERLNIDFMSSGEGLLFTEKIDDFTKKIREIGPLGESEGLDEAELKTGLQEIRKLIPYIKLEMREKLSLRLEDEAEYEGFYTAEEVADLLENVATYWIDPAKCQACQICARRCPAEAIEGAKGQIHVIDQDKCIKCGSCFEACPDRFGAIERLSGQAAPLLLPKEERTLVKEAKK